MQTLPIRLNIQEEIYHKLADTLSAQIKVAMPGIIQSFNPVKQTAVIQLSIYDRINLNGIVTWEQIPLLVDVPVMFPRAGGYSITFPVTEGNECLVIFADMCIDAQYQNGGINNIQMDRRRHDLSDGFAIITGTSQPNSLASVNTSSLIIQKDDGTATIKLAENAINITAGTINITGSSVVIGSDTTIDSRVFLAHTHSGVTTGTGVSGGVV